jgi:hypothetical protein
MPTRQQHLSALRDYLNAVLAGHIAPEISRKRIGLSTDAHASLHWIRQSPFAGRDSTDIGLLVAFGDGCGGRSMPRHLRSPLDGSSVPVEAVRGGYAGRVQSVAVINETISDTSALRGTLGGILRSNNNPQQLLALTAGHVVGASSEARVGNIVSLTPTTGPRMMGLLFNWSPDFVNVPSQTNIDAGLVQVSAQMLEPLTGQPSEWPVRAAQPFANSALRLRARGAVFNGSAPEYLSCRMEVTTDATTFYFVKDALCWNVSEASMDGDSGAPIWNSDDELVAIHTGSAPAGAGRNAVAVPIGRILRWAGASVVVRGENLFHSAPARNGTLLSGAAVSVTRPSQQPQGGQPSAAAPTQLAPEIRTLARTMWGEARGEGELGMGAVAHVVLNRRVQLKYWGKTIEEVCTKPFQFSCWNANDPNLPRLQRVTEADASYALALKLARELASLAEGVRASRDPTLGATHYYARQLQPPPRWARGKTPCARIGNHLFYRDIA